MSCGKLKYSVLLFGLSLTLLMSCDQGRIIDEYVPVENGSWSLSDTCLLDFSIDDTTSFYRLFFNLRHNDEYKYSNLYVFLTITDPDGLRDRKRLNFLLADKKGKWMGRGLGGRYDNQIILVDGLKFLKDGDYGVTIEQNMRDNPLEGITDVGIRLEKISE